MKIDSKENPFSIASNRQCERRIFAFELTDNSEEVFLSVLVEVNGSKTNDSIEIVMRLHVSKNHPTAFTLELREPTEE